MFGQGPLNNVYNIDHWNGIKLVSVLLLLQEPGRRSDIKSHFIVFSCHPGLQN